MNRRDHKAVGNGVPLGKIAIVVGMTLVVLGIGGLVYRQLDSEGDAEAGAFVTPTVPAATSTPAAGADRAQQASLTQEPTPSSSPNVQPPVTATPSPHPTQAETPTMQPSPTPSTSATPSPTATVAGEPAQPTEAPLPPADAPTQPPPIEAPPPGPEPPADDSPDGSTITHIQLPAADIDTPVVEIGYNLIDIEGQTVIEWNVAQWAAGHHSISANPGHGGNVVIAGHVAGAGEVFRNLEYAEVGNEVIVSTTEGEFRYIIEEVHLRLEAGAPLEERLAIGSFMAPMPEDRLTLVTCWPYGVYDHRLIVVAKPA